MTMSDDEYISSVNTSHCGILFAGKSNLHLSSAIKPGPSQLISQDNGLSKQA